MNMRQRVYLLLIVLIISLASCGTQRTLADVQPYLRKDLTPQRAEQALGKPDEVTGSGLLIYVYHLANRQTVHLGFPGYAPIMYARLQTNGGPMADLPLK
jgi:hypothetical protein